MKTQLYNQRKSEYPDFYSAQVKRILSNLNDINIKYNNYKCLDFNIEFGINVIKEFLNSLDNNYLDIFKLMLKENLINISKDKNKDEKGKHEVIIDDKDISKKEILINFIKVDTNKTFSIDINCHNLESMLYILSHEIGHAISTYYSGNFSLKKNLTSETVSQLFPLMLSDFLKEKYHTINIFDKEKENFNLLMTGIEKIDDYKDLILYNEYSNIKLTTFKDDAENYENRITYIYSYFLADQLYTNYKNTNSLNQINRMMTLSYNSYELDSLLKEINVDKRSVGTKKMIKEIKNRFK